MRSRRRRTVFLVVFLLVELVVWGAPYAGRVYFKAIESPPPPVSAVLPPASVPVLATAPEFHIIERWALDTPESLAAWEEKIFKGKTQYLIQGDESGGYLKASSQASSSGLYQKIRRAVEPGLILSWEWKAAEFPKKPHPNRLAAREQDDFAARLYVIFPGRTFFDSRVIEYLWDEFLSEGTVASSPFSSRVKLFVVRSGPGNRQGGWTREERNLYEDYTALFESKPDRPLEAIAIMSDSDNTRTSSTAFFRNLEIKTRK